MHVLNEKKDSVAYCVGEKNVFHPCATLTFSHNDMCHKLGLQVNHMHDTLYYPLLQTINLIVMKHSLNEIMDVFLTLE